MRYVWSEVWPKLTPIKLLGACRGVAQPSEPNQYWLIMILFWWEERCTFLFILLTFNSSQTSLEVLAHGQNVDFEDRLQLKFQHHYHADCVALVTMFLWHRDSQEVTTASHQLKESGATALFLFFALSYF